MKSTSLRRARLAILFAAFVLFSLSNAANAQSPAGDSETRRPNIVVILADDMGYGDLSCYGHPRIRTPNIDRLADDGMRFTSFLTGVWCVPSRTQLITGRYMPRVKFGGHTGSDGTGGLPDSERTLAEALKEAGYRTHMLGKWHLGYKKPEFLPPNQGFDTWFGMPYSNDYRKPWVQTDEPLALYRGTEIVEHPVDQDTLTKRYTEEAVKIIDAAGKEPFFLYLAHNMPHLPIHTTEEFRGKSQAGLYGDVIETIDWSVGQILEALERNGITEDTIVFFASDNGPWLNFPPRMHQEGNELWHVGSPGHLRGAKGGTYDGGACVPAMIRWPGKIRPNQDSPELAAMVDIYRTLITAAGGSLPDHPIDGYDLMPWLTGKENRSPRTRYYYFLGQLEAIRDGDWKLRTATGEPELFNMRLDPSERFNRAKDEPTIVAELTKAMEEFAAEVGTKVRGVERRTE